MAEPRYSIIIRPCPFGGATYDVVVEPTPAWANFDRERPTLHAARRYAESLKTVHVGWVIRDETGEAA
jgi:hypothetical protein